MRGVAEDFRHVLRFERGNSATICSVGMPSATIATTGVLALLSAVLGAAALFFGAGAASAHHCETQPSDPGNLTFTYGGLVEAGTDHNDFGNPNNVGTWVCTWNAHCVQSTDGR